MSHHRAVVPFRVDFSGDVLLWFTCKAMHESESFSIWTINCDIVILKLVCHFSVVSATWPNFLNEEKSSVLKLVE